MFGLPVALRELAAASRRPQTAAARTTAAGVAAVVFLALLAAGVRAPSPTSPGLFHGMAIAAFGLACAGGLLAADAVSAERRDGTLGLLFLADLGGLSLILGKLAARGLSACLALGAVTPVLALCWMAGGVTPGEFLRTLLALGNTLFFSLALALWVSSRRTDSGAAFAETMLWILAALCLGLAHRLVPAAVLPAGGRWWLGVSPWVAFRAARDPAVGGDPARFGPALGLAHGAAWLCLLAAARAARRYRDPVRTRRVPVGVSVEVGEDHRTVRVHRPRPRIDPVALDAHPLQAVLAATRRAPALLWILASLGAASRLGADAILLARPEWRHVGLGPVRVAKALPAELALIGFHAAELVVAAGVAAAAAMQVCRFIVESRETGGLELLMTSGLADDEVFSALWGSLRSSFAGPLLLWAGLGLIGPLLGTVQYWGDTPSDPAAWWSHWFQLVVGLPLRLWAAAAFAAWCALGGVRSGAALRTALFWGALVPGVAAASDPYLAPAVVLGFAQHRLRQPLRTLMETHPPSST